MKPRTHWSSARATLTWLVHAHIKAVVVALVCTAKGVWVGVLGLDVGLETTGWVLL